MVCCLELDLVVTGSLCWVLVGWCFAYLCLFCCLMFCGYFDLVDFSSCLVLVVVCVALYC